MAVSAKDVKTLREKTGVGMMDCKKALTETNGNIEEAIVYLRKQGMAAADKKAGRVAAEGLVHAYVADNQHRGVMLEVNCETDFVAKNDDFVSFGKDLCQLISETQPADVEALMATKMGDSDVQSLVHEKVGKIGEKISIRRFATYDSDNGVVHTYIHGGGTIGVLVEMAVADASKQSSDEFVSLYKDIAMQIAAASPSYLVREEVPSDEVNKEIEIYKEVMRKEGKKEEMLEKIAQGKLGKFYSEVCLMEQPFVKETKMKVNQLLKEVGTKIGSEITIKRFQKFVLGEGIEKKEENFAEEVMGQIK